MLMSCSTLEYMDRPKTKTRINFVEYLESDISVYIMSFLDDPADLVRISAVSRLWRQFVIANGLAKQLCLKTLPQLSSIVSVVPTEGTVKSVEVITNMFYASLLHAIVKSEVSPKDCIENAVSASSTDIYPNESVVNTLNPRDKFIYRPSYWSSKGQCNPEVPETLIYKLRVGIWVITEVDIHPFEAFFQEDTPIYSAKSVRFRMGHLKSPKEIGIDLLHFPWKKAADDKFEWTYTSPEFPMTQENFLQPFMLPEPVVCIGGYLQIELLGRVQRQVIDGLFYFRVCFVRIRGRPLFPAFDVESVEPNGEALITYYPEKLNCALNNSSRKEAPYLRQLEIKIAVERIGLLQDLLRGIQQYPPDEIEDEYEDEDDDDDDDDDDDEDEDDDDEVTL